MNINDALESIASFYELLPFVQKASARLSSWNGRYIEINGYKGILDIDQLAEKVDALFDPNALFNQSESICRREVVQRIIQIYKESDKLYENSSFAIKVVLFIRNIFLHIFCCHCINKTNTRELWEYGTKRVLSGYGSPSKQQYKPWEPCLKRLCS